MRNFASAISNALRWFYFGGMLTKTLFISALGGGASGRVPEARGKLLWTLWTLRIPGPDTRSPDPAA